MLLKPFSNDGASYSLSPQDALQAAMSSSPFRNPVPIGSQWSAVLADLLENDEVKGWLLNRSTPIEASSTALNSSIGYECRWPTGDHEVDRGWSTRPGDLFVCEKFLPNGFALGTIFGRGERLMYSVGIDSLEKIKTSLETKVRRVVVYAIGDILTVIEFCWMKDDSLVIAAKTILLAQSTSSVRLKGEIWYLKKGPNNHPSARLEMPDRVFTFCEAKPICVLCNGAGCVLCSSGIMEDPATVGQGLNERLRSQSTFSSKENPCSWDDIGQRVAALQYSGKLEAHYFTRGTFRPSTSLTIGSRGCVEGGQLGCSFSFKLPFACKGEADPAVISELRQAYLSKAWAADIGMRKDVTLWNNYVDSLAPSAGQRTQASEPRRDTGQSHPWSYRDVAAENEAIVREIEGIVHEDVRMTRDRNVYATQSLEHLNPSLGLQQEVSALPTPFAQPSLLQSFPHSQAQALPSATQVPFQVPETSSVVTSTALLSSSPSIDSSPDLTRKVGDRDYRCVLCDKSFVKKSNVIRHRQTVHEKRRPFKCDICNHTFGHRTHLLRHQKTIHKMTIVKTRRRPRERTPPVPAIPQVRGSVVTESEGSTNNHPTPISCPICNHHFSQRSNLNRHIRNAHQRRRVQCQICFQDFGQMYDLQRHFRRKHPELEDFRAHSSTIVKQAEEGTEGMMSNVALLPPSTTPLYTTAPYADVAHRTFPPATVEPTNVPSTSVPPFRGDPLPSIPTQEDAAVFGAEIRAVVEASRSLESRNDYRTGNTVGRSSPPMSRRPSDP